MQSITAAALKQRLEQKEELQLVDVREAFEHDAFHIGGELVPLGEINARIAEISKDKPVVVYCRKGIRSQIAIQRLLDKYPFTNLLNLEGGIEAWKAAFGAGNTR